MNKFSVALLALASVLAISPAAKADTYDLSFAGTGTGVLGDFFGSAILTTTGAGGVVTSATGGTLTFTGGGGGTVTATLDTSPVSYFNFGLSSTETTDNTIVLPANLDSNGLALNLSDGYTLVLADDEPTTGYVFQYFKAGVSADEGNATGELSSTTTVTPEPGSLFLLGSGILGLAMVLFMKAKSSSFGLKI